MRVTNNLVNKYREDPPEPRVVYLKRLIKLINKIDKPLVRLIRKNVTAQITNKGNMKGNITSEPTDIKTRRL